jgi:hypothetical protein
MDWSSDAAKMLVPGLFVVLGALFALIGSLIVGLNTSAVAASNNRKNLFVNTVTAERAKWRQDLRTAMAEMRRASEIALAAPSTDNLAALHAQRVQVRLRLNPSPDPKHHLDRDALAALKRLPQQVAARNAVAADATLEALETAIQTLLKQEWDKSKQEARTGELQV